MFYLSDRGSSNPAGRGPPRRRGAAAAGPEQGCVRPRQRRHPRPAGSLRNSCRAAAGAIKGALVPHHGEQFHAKLAMVRDGQRTLADAGLGQSHAPQHRRLQPRGQPRARDPRTPRWHSWSAGSTPNGTTGRRRASNRGFRHLRRSGAVELLGLSPDGGDRALDVLSDAVPGGAAGSRSHPWPRPPPSPARAIRVPRSTRPSIDSACAAARERVDDRQQDHRATERTRMLGTLIGRVDRRHADQRADQQAAEERRRPCRRSR